MRDVRVFFCPGTHMEHFSRFENNFPRSFKGSEKFPEFEGAGNIYIWLKSTLNSSINRIK